uniref:Uncharacterized protein n=2 Tax=Hemiselmis andersenii TaxID=464988 RepID=A0A6T8NY51_HEMAN
MDIGSLDSKFQRVMDPSLDIGAGATPSRQGGAGGQGAMGGGQWESPVAGMWPQGGGGGGGGERKPSPEGRSGAMRKPSPERRAGAMREHESSGASSLYSSGEGRREMSMGTDGGSLSSVDGMLSRSSTASRDSIAMSVRQLLCQGEAQVDALRTVEGREATFGDDWLHRGNPRLLKSKMACAGFIHTPDSQVQDKVTCVYCGLELGMWEPGDDPWVEHHEGAPGCSFWRRSSLAGERISKDILFTGYGSPYHSFQRSAGQDMQRSLAAYAASQQDHSPKGGGHFDRTLNGEDKGQTFAF